MTDQLETGIFQQVIDVAFVTGVEVVHAQDFVARLQKPFAEMRAEEPAAPGDQNRFVFHGAELFLNFNSSSLR